VYSTIYDWKSWVAIARDSLPLLKENARLDVNGQGHIQ